MVKTPSSKRRPLDVDTLWQLQRLGAPSLSPDGRQAVCSVTTSSMEDNSNRSQLWLLPTAGSTRPRQLTSCGDKDGRPAWSPRGDAIAFLARREQQGHKDSTPQLYLIAPDGGEARRISDFAPGIESFKWLPDGRRIAFSAWVWPELKGAKAQAQRHKAFSERKESGYATSEAFYRYWDDNVPMGRVQHLLLLDVASGRITDLFEGTALELPRQGGSPELYDISPDGRLIAFVHDPAAVPLASNRTALSEIELRTRRVRALVDDAAWDFAGPCYSPDGRSIAVLAANVGRHHTALAEPALVQADGSGWQLLAPGWDHSLNTPLRWARDGSALYFSAEERGRCPLWRLALGERTPSTVVTGGSLLGFDLAGDTLAWAIDSARHPAQIWAQQGSTAPQRLERFNDALLKNVDLGEVREISVRGALGDNVQVWLTFPPGFNPKKKHPIVHVIHGGPFAAAGEVFGYRWSPHVFAAMDAQPRVIAQVNYHGSSSFGHAFRHSLIGRQGELELQDIEAATDWLLAQPWADAQHVYAAGGSYGGFLVAWMNGHVAPGRYRAYVCHAGVFDRVATFSADSWPARPMDLAAKYWEDMPRVLAQSPHAFAGRMATPTLVTHGARDYRVPDCNGLAYYNTLKARDVDVRLLWFPDENHWVLKPRNSRQWYAEFAAWLQRHGGAKQGPKRAHKPGA
jgi:dipeptidyl aminopeptidase/acylaminoacyl peptidase